MKLLFDENLSSKLVSLLSEKFPKSSHIEFLKMQGTTDGNIWEYARTENYIIVSKDNDFRQRSFLFGFPPKVIWLSVGNGGTKIIKKILLDNEKTIEKVANNSVEGLLVLKLSDDNELL